MTAETTTIHDGLVWPESPRWHAGQLWITEAFGQNSGVRSLSPDGTQTLHIPVSGGPAGMDFLSDGTAVLAVAFDRKILMRRPGESEFSTFLDLDGIATYPNELIVGPADRIFVSDSGFQVGAEPYVSGRIIVVETDGSARVVSDDLAFPNGLAMPPGGSSLTVAESFAGRLTSIRIGKPGVLAERRTQIAFDDLGLVQDVEIVMSRPFAPDGICLDLDGNIWVANPLSADVLCHSIDGGVTDRVQISQGGIACMLGGDDGRTLFVTTGDISDMYSSSGRIEVARVSVPGAGYPATTRDV